MGSRQDSVDEMTNNVNPDEEDISRVVEELAALHYSQEDWFENNIRLTV